MSAKLIAFEGLDCSFKETNSQALYDYLKEKGLKVYLFHFPSYGEPSAYFVEQYLRGEYNSIDNDGFNPYSISLFYSLDRFYQWQTKIKSIYDNEDDAIIILDRWTNSNIFFQSAREIPAKQNYIKYKYHDTYSFINIIEHDILSLPREDLIIYMDISFDISREIIKKRKLLDLNESSDKYMKNVYENAPSIINDIKYYLGEDQIVCIKCDDGKEVRSKKDIFNDIKEAVGNLLYKFNLGGKFYV